MNISFFLIPKQEVTFLDKNSTLRQALEKMEYHKYSAIPILDKNGRYIGTLTEGDLLWKMKNTPGLMFENTNKIMINDIPWKMRNRPVRINARMEDLIELAITQNFIPVVDDQDIFIGIVRRREIIEYTSKFINQQNAT
ncbi:CBS domain-containing protein [Desulfonispora thiosulfatigenes DSM 11270]|uniref:CBS domain-containing protein n=1 Tax=Desulfonispora thiosulfatigenes DSM 11270 TaxID=656914 RepID=A0A1W1VTW7_DESTI|nr:CBS domain-containing protein [Desulfonispora thiosulfatigenes]SMB96551.1 CBS domain-containing protein [Desulfonispora thiosulfatigenes DSM 11270]